MIDKEFYNSREAAMLLGVSVLRVYQIIREGRISVIRREKEILIPSYELIAYLKSKHSRSRHFTDEKISVRTASKILQCGIQRVYYLVRKGDLHATPFIRKNYWLNRNQVERYKMIYNANRKNAEVRKFLKKQASKAKKPITLRKLR